MLVTKKQFSNIAATVFLLPWLLPSTLTAQANISSAVASGQSSVGTFESPDLASGNFQYTPTDPTWTYSSAGLSENASGFTAANPNAPQGTQVAFIQGTGNISRTFSVATAGKFAFSFYMAQRAGNDQTLSLLIDGVSISNFCVAGSSYTLVASQGIYLSAGNHTIKFVGLNPKGGDNTAFIDDVKYARLNSWSQASTWVGGVVPKAGDNVTIVAGSLVFVDQNVNVKSISVYGKASVDLSKNIDISAEYIMVMGTGAYFGWGDDGRPYTKKGSITLVGNDPNANVPGHGAASKGILVMDGGILKLQGSAKTSWTNLNANVAAGASSITVASANNWAVGDEIVITSSREDHNEAEQRTITAISADKKTLTLNKALVYPHVGKIKTYTRKTDNKSWVADMRAEVGMLSKNIKIQGDANSDINGFGGHIMIHRGGMGYVDGVELYHMGQKSILGRYPFHWHLVEDGGQGQYIKNTSIHHTYNRAITIHATESTLVDSNFCYDHIGHGLFLEDGVERFNVITNNVVLLTKRPKAGEQLIPSDNSDNEVQNRTPSSFWITNPNNTFENNVAAGTEGTGFWFIMPRNPVGASVGDPYFAGQKPNEEALGKFYGNKSHSCGNGFDIFDQLNDDHSLAKNGGWDRTDDRFLDAHTFYGCGTAIYGGIGDGRTYVENVIFRDNIFIDNGTAIMHANYSLTLNSCFVANSGEDVLKGNRHLNRGYDGACSLSNCHLVGWQAPNANYLENTGGSVKHVNYRVSGITKDFLGAPNMALGDYSKFPKGDVGANDAAHPRFWSYVTWDKDGSLAGLANSSIVTNHPLCRDGSEERFENWTNIYRTKHRFALFMLQYPGYDRPNVTIVRTKAGTPKVGMFYIHGFEDNPQLPFIVNEDFLYTLQFETLHPDKTVHLTMLDDYVTGDNFLVCLKEFGKLGGLNLHGVPNAGSLAAVKSATATSYAVVNGDLYVKIVRKNDPDFIGASVSWSSDIALAYLDTDNDGISDSQEAMDGTDPVGNDPISEKPVLLNPVLKTAWEFNTNGNSESWTLANSLTGSVIGGAQKLTVSGSDPNFNSPSDLGISAYSYPYLRFRIKSDQAGTMEVFWATASNPGFAGSRHTTFSVQNTNGAIKEYVLNMNDFPNWTGEISALRLDPEFGLNGNIEFDHISFEKSNLLDCEGTWGGSAKIDLCEICSGGTTGLTPCIRWDFNTAGNSEGWKAGNNLSSSVNNGCNSLTVNGGDPNWYSPVDLGVDAALYPYMRFVINTNVAGKLEIFFGTNLANGASGARLKTLQIPNTNGQNQEFFIKMSDHAEWKGTIHDLRIDPEFGTGNSVCIDLVAFETSMVIVTPFTQINGGTWTGSSTATVCAGGSVSFGPQPNVETGWTWTGPNNFTASTRQVTFTAIKANKAGNYVATYTDGNGNKGSKTFTIAVDALPTATISTTTPTTFCDGGSVVLTASTGTSYKWYNGATALATTTAAHTANASGSYTVEITNAAGCKATSTAKVVTVNALPTATITTTTPTTFCDGGSVVLTASAGTSYKWYNGATALATTTAAHTANASGSYTVEITNAAGCKATSAAKVVTVNALPTATISTTTPTTFCEGGSAVLTASAGTSYKWYNGATALATTTAAHTANANGSYTVEIINAAGCKATSAAKVVTVNALPTATISTTTPTTFCDGGSVVLTASAGTSYKWYNGATALATATAAHTANANGSYTVEVSNANGCKATSAAKVVTVNALPTATITTTTPTTFCEGGSVVLTASAGTAYKWYNGASALATTTAANTANTSGSYTVEITNSAGCKATSAAKVVTVNALPTATISTTTPTTFCEGGSVVLTSSAGSAYKWYKGTTALTTTTATHTANASGSYIVEVTNANACKATSAAKVVTVNALPTLSITSTSDTICSGSAATLTAKGASTYVWNTGGTAATLTISPLSTTTYTVTGTDANKCVNTKNYTIVAEICTGINNNAQSEANEMIKVYPNPACNILNVQLNTAADIQTLYLINALGEIVLSQKVANTNTEMDIQNLSSGVYMLQMGNTIQKVIIAK